MKTTHKQKLREAKGSDRSRELTRKDPYAADLDPDRLEDQWEMGVQRELMGDMTLPESAWWLFFDINMEGGF